MSGDNVQFLPQAPVRNEALEREAQSAHTTMRELPFAGRSEFSKPELPKLTIVADSAEANRVESRLSKLGALSAEIKISRDEALANERKRAEGKIVQIAQEAPRTQTNVVERNPEKYDHTNLAQARERAQKEGKNVVIEFGRNGCTWCTRQEQEMDKPAVKAAASDAIVVHINGSYAPAIASKYGITGYPTTIVESANGQIIYNHKGALGANELISVLKMPPR